MLAFDFTDHLIGLYGQNLLLTVRNNFGLMCLRFAIAATLATTIATLSRMYFEEWFLRLKEKLVPPAGNRRSIECAALRQSSTNSSLKVGELEAALEHVKFR